MLKAWRMVEDDQVVSQFEKNFATSVSEQELKEKTGVNYHHVNVDDLDNDPEFQALKKKMGITYQDNVVISPSTMPEYNEKVNQIFYLLSKKI